MASEALHGPIQGLVVLAETEAGEVPRRLFGGVVKGADRNGGDPRLHSDMAAEVLVGAVEDKGPKGGRQKMGAGAGQHAEADVGQRACQTIALALHVAGKLGVVAVVEAQA